MDSAVTDFLLDLIDRELQKVEMSFIAKIISFDKAKMRATVRPMLKIVSEEKGKDNPEDIDTLDIQNVPVEMLFAGQAYIRPDYEKDDLVKISVYASSIQQPIDSGIRSDMFSNRFQLNYCTVSAGVRPENFVFPDSFDDEPGLIIGKGSMFMVFESSKIRVEGGDLDVDGDINATGSINATGDIVAGPTGFRVKLLTHVHGAAGTPPVTVP